MFVVCLSVCLSRRDLPHVLEDDFKVIFTINAGTEVLMYVCCKIID